MRSCPETETRRLAMLHSAMGDTLMAALLGEHVTDIILNPDGHLWIDRHGGGREVIPQAVSPDQAERIIRLVATQAGEEVTLASPIVSAELPSGERFEGILPPVTATPTFAIRKPGGRVLRLADYQRSGVMEAEAVRVLRDAVEASLNILVVGGTGSGKTTLANALLSELDGLDQRVIVLEDTRELRSSAMDTVALRTTPDTTLRDLVRSTMRLRPDRIIVGEVRGGEALELLKAWTTGHPGGIATIHANSARSGLTRLEQLVGEVSQTIPRKLIAEAVDVVVFLKGRGEARRVEEVCEVIGCAVGESGRDYKLVDLLARTRRGTPTTIIPFPTPKKEVRRD